MERVRTKSGAWERLAVPFFTSHKCTVLTMPIFIILLLYVSTTLRNQMQFAVRAYTSVLISVFAKDQARISRHFLTVCPMTEK